ncbi:MAG TPA: histidine phosphatase family protein [Gemmatimonadota bacterium]|jgi:broad specificity phosphatase PhoE
MATTPARLLLLRHPETDWNREGRWQGHSDPPVNARGRAQMAEALASLPPERWAAIYTSDLLRARETADWLGARLDLRPRVSPTLRERRMGDWEGLTPEEARAASPDAYPRVEADPWREPPPGGESFAELLARVAPELERIASRHAGEAVLVVTHGGILKAVLCVLLDLDFTRREELGMANGAQALLESGGRRWTLLKPLSLAARQKRHDLDAQALR